MYVELLFEYFVRSKDIGKPNLCLMHTPSLMTSNKKENHLLKSIRFKDVTV